MFSRRTERIIAWIGNGSVWAVLAFSVLMVILGLFSSAHAGTLFTEVGGGVKVAGTSAIAMPECVTVWQAADELSCGGDNPMAVGWLLAWEFDNPNLRVGWLHISHWLDGRRGPRFLRRGDASELAINCICVTYRHNWLSR